MLDELGLISDRGEGLFSALQPPDGSGDQLASYPVRIGGHFPGNNAEKT
jgi:hypothetical protein